MISGYHWPISGDHWPTAGDHWPVSGGTPTGLCKSTCYTALP